MKSTGVAGRRTDGDNKGIKGKYPGGGSKESSINCFRSARPLGEEETTTGRIGEATTMGGEGTEGSGKRGFRAFDTDDEGFPSTLTHVRPTSGELRLMATDWRCCCSNFLEIPAILIGMCFCFRGVLVADFDVR